MPGSPPTPAATITLGGDLTVRRMGYGAMQLTGPGVWGEPADRCAAIQVLRTAVELGVDFIDTADSYGPAVNEELIREALYPYPAGLVIATKGGLVRPGPGQWVAVGRPAYLRQQVEMSLRQLRLDRIDLYQLHRVDPEVSLADQLGELAALQAEGKIRHIGLSEVGVDLIEEAQRIARIVSVQNRYNLADRGYDTVVDYAERAGIAFVAWFPLANGLLAGPRGTLAEAARQRWVTPAQLSLAWLLRRSAAILAIPGTSKLAHLADNVAAVGIGLDDEAFAALTAAR
jgi:pyridoxine 4-dehydrogenase